MLYNFNKIVDIMNKASAGGVSKNARALSYYKDKTKRMNLKSKRKRNLIKKATRSGKDFGKISQKASVRFRGSAPASILARFGFEVGEVAKIGKTG